MDCFAIGTPITVRTVIVTHDQPRSSIVGLGYILERNLVSDLHASADVATFSEEDDPRIDGLHDVVQRQEFLTAADGLVVPFVRRLGLWTAREIDEGEFVVVDSD
jgi:hypothetical protein